jgi:hypothetical protein
MFGQLYLTNLSTYNQNAKSAVCPTEVRSVIVIASYHLPSQRHHASLEFHDIRLASLRLKMTPSAADLIRANRL